MPRCRCKSPPGGGIECNQHQLAVCQVVDGQCESQCIDVPLDMLQAMRTSGIKSAAVMAWLQGALGLPSAKGLLPPATLNVLPDGSGHFFHADFPGIVRFSLPLEAAQEELGAD